ncbi:hypothetical protein ABPG72_007764 [Tetrahymena utriculariae]
MDQISISDLNQEAKQINIQQIKSLIEQDQIYNQIQKLLNDQNFHNQMNSLYDLEAQQKYGNCNLEFSETEKKRYFNSSMKVEVKKISQEFPKFIDVRGDGNCFYRSVILSFLLQVFRPIENDMNPEIQIKAILRLLRQVYNLENCIKKYKMNLPYNITEAQIISFQNLFLTNILRFLDELLSGQDVSKSIIDALNNFNLLDFSSVIICRYMIFKQFLLHKSNPSLSQFRDQDIIKNIEQLLLKYGTQAEDMIIKLAAEAFQCNLIVQNLYQIGSDVISNQLIFKTLTEQNQISLNVPVLYLNGHYMCLVDQLVLKKIQNLSQKNNTLRQMNIIYEEPTQQQSSYFSKPQDELKDIFDKQQLENNKNIFEKYFKNDLCFSLHTDQNFQQKSQLKQISIKQSIKIKLCSKCFDDIQKQKKEEYQYFHLKNDELKESLVYQVLETKFIKATIDCLNQVRNQAGTFNHKQGYKESIKSEESSIFIRYLYVCFSTIIALDTQKEGYVCGIIIGIDFCYFIELLRKLTSDSLMKEKNQMALKLLEPLIVLNYQKGDCLIGMNFGVRTEYENLKIGQNLFRLYQEKALELGQSITAVITSNPVSTHITQKNNLQTYSYVMQDLNHNNLPSALEEFINGLNKSTSLYIYQKFDVETAFLCVAPRKYKIYGEDEQKKMVSNKPLVFAQERSNFLCRNCCPGDYQPFRMNAYQKLHAKDEIKNEIKVDQGSNCYIQPYLSVSIRTQKNGPFQFIDKIKDPIKLCPPREWFNTGVDVHDQNDNLLYIIEVSEFKCASDCVKNALIGMSNFKIIYPEDITYENKVLILAATFFIQSQMFIDSPGEQSEDVDDILEILG